jgi:hypothetical protein
MSLRLATVNENGCVVELGKAGRMRLQVIVEAMAWRPLASVGTLIPHRRFGPRWGKVPLLAAPVKREGRIAESVSGRQRRRRLLVEVLWRC